MQVKQTVRRAAYSALQIARIVPNKWSVGNAFKVFEFRKLVSDAGLKQNHVVLDLGCGKGTQTQLLAPGCHKIVGLDVEESCISEARRLIKRSAVRHKAEFVCGSIMDACFPDASFDHVFCFSVLEHIDNLPAVLREVARVTRPGGQLHLSVDSLTSIKNLNLIAKHRRDHFVVQYFTPQTLTALLESAGFAVAELFPIFTSTVARKAFEHRIEKGGPRWLPSKMRLYWQLKTGDSRNASAEGVMLIARACREQNPNNGVA
jgi:ubiquinone/menaquinone biosynthesis C-methylase UbiE